MRMVPRSLGPDQRPGFSLKLSTTFWALAVIASLLGCDLIEASAQGMLRGIKQPRRAERIQKRIDRQTGTKLATGGEPAHPTQSAAPSQNESAPPQKHNLEGISQSDPRDFFNRFFSKDEREMAILGFGRPTAFVIILRQLELTEEQKQSIKAIRRRVGNQLIIQRRQQATLDNQLEEAIYGDNFDPKRVEELSTLAGQKQAEITKLQASIEAQFREILTQDQFFVFRFLVGEMLLPQRRPQQLRRQGPAFNPQNRSNQENPKN